jgi:uncharacterized membrane protein YidH (DUF202 family)
MRLASWCASGVSVLIALMAKYAKSASGGNDDSNLRTSCIPYYFRAPALPNTGSLARDFLASEPTFLALMRTGLGFIALGVALEKIEALTAISPTLLHLENSRTKLAAGILVASRSRYVVHGTHRYLGTMRLLQEGKFWPNVPEITLAAVTSVGITLAGSLMVIGNGEGKEGAVREREFIKVNRMCHGRSFVGVVKTFI